MARSALLTYQPGISCVLLLFSFSLFSLSSCKERADAASPDNKPRGVEPTLVDVLIAAQRPINNEIEANGSVVANEYVELHPEISGRIVYLNVPEGVQVAKGAVIARINDADLQATLAKSKAQLELYQKTEERERKLLEINGINQADYDLAVSNVNTTKADIDYTQAQLDKTVIRAPFDGVVGLRQVSPGAYVTPANIIATVQQMDKTKVDFTIPEQYSAVVRKGSLVDVQLDAQAGAIRRRKGLIVATEPQINLSSRNLKVRALLQDGVAHPGSFVKVFVSAGVDKRAIMVPTNCIIPEDRNNQVILVKQGKAKVVNVQTGVREASNIEITRGVDAGDTVIVTGVLFARPDAPVTIRSVKTGEETIPTAANAK
ncbi:efflux RND transporter periplasmic adaptor subunit [Puia dinghuensis]|uniref:MexH family multidrug efflux RND transporter periplasmic adaptor subunit n=1 Tax=Puia dinghuensis TaxID=1792502 RepID=A0A8J2XNA1_9BACT|nr:efflux RND transporter periplasmic adaptor subunit [Puia dinghuensis]GGA82990.1 MexH family multidrug efflux RND transporter periplasmic adaptor subunit [Puia dinghuensis]